MSSIELTPACVFALKSRLRIDYDEVKSSHLTEALAVALGFKTHAALKTKMEQVKPDDAPFVFLSEDKFTQQLKAFGYLKNDKNEEFYFGYYKESGVVETVPLSAYEIDYLSLRDKAWRNIIVLTINVALDKKLFTLRNNDNRWDGWVDRNSPDHGTSKGCLFDFVLPNELPARGYIYDAGFGELGIHVAINPKGDHVKAHNAGFYAGDVFATSWLERDTGAWLQSSTTNFNCRKNLLKELAEMIVVPKGFGDKGRVIM